MNKEIFLQQLRRHLINMSEEEKDDIIRYYEEYFDDAGTEQEQAILDELGSPVMLARKLSAECAIKEIDAREQQQKRPMSGSIFALILAICSFPVWFPFAIVLAVLVFTLVLLLFVFIFCFGVVAISFLFACALSLVFGVVLLFSDLANALAILGSGLMMGGIGILLFLLSRFLVRQITRAIVAIGKRKVDRM